MNSSTNNSNVFPINAASEIDLEDSTTDEELQLWSALTLGSLQKQLTGQESDPRFSAAQALVDGIAKEFATANPIEIADYFEAISAVAALRPGSLNRLDEIDSELLAA